MRTDLMNIEDAVDRFSDDEENTSFWIPIDEYTYEDEPDILFFDGERVGVCHYDLDAGYFLENGWKMKEKPPTHWMPLPVPPKV